MTQSEKSKRYWRKNLTYLAILLSVWFFFSFGCGILFADWLDGFRVGGFPLGFWFAQQGSIYVFVALVFVYVYLMNRLDHEFDVES
ncbi:MAG: DUF4212 domain-containing protein [bacterium]|nr:DUF4212 domain-containing protein [bacterium]